MNTFRYLIASVLLAFTAYGQTVSAAFLAGRTSLSTTPVSISAIQIYDTSGAINLIRIFDTNLGVTNRVYAGFTGVVQYTTNITTTFVNFSGVSESRTFASLATAPLVVAQATNSARIVWTATIPANSFVTLTPTTSFGTTYGVLLETAGAGYYNLTRRPLP